MSEHAEDRKPGTPAAPKRRMFANKAKRLSADAVERQSRVTLMAWDLLGADTARTFLNAYNETLDARPLDLAVASADGCDAVELAISARAADSSGRNLRRE